MEGITRYIWSYRLMQVPLSPLLFFQSQLFNASLRVPNAITPPRSAASPRWAPLSKGERVPAALPGPAPPSFLPPSVQAARLSWARLGPGCRWSPRHGQRQAAAGHAGMRSGRAPLVPRWQRGRSELSLRVPAAAPSRHCVSPLP